ncbi:hypothetical protein C8Q80DRAFT_324160 [Daedaleopsis nitida]|nr:hypothetical protein C8Q80DRAFT_324160 [Daedaleopsis nitida]
MEEVSCRRTLQDISPLGFVVGEVHFAIVPVIQDRCRGHSITSSNSKVRCIYFANNPSKAPSSEGVPVKFENAHINKQPENWIYCGRPYFRSTPPSLLDETLCELRSNLDSITPSPKDIQCYDRLREAAVHFYDHEDKRRDAFTTALTAGGILPVPASPTKIATYTTDGALVTECLGRVVLYYIQVIKNELSAGGAEPYLEAILYFVEHIRPIILDSSTGPNDWSKINFPVILVMHFGPYLAIAAGTYTDAPNVEHLCCIPLHVHPTNTTQLEAGERALAALRVALHSLRMRYPDLPMTRRPPAEFPFRDYYYVDDADGVRHTYEFTYVEAIAGKRIFRAKLADGTPLCVKFCTRYSADAHRAAHKAHFAPALRAVNQVYAWIMVVMDDVSEDYTNTMHDLCAREQTPVAPAVPPATVRILVKEKLAELHAAGLVHGDVRSINVLVRNKEATSVPPGRDVLLVDFDWAGPEGETTYPRGMNPAITRPVDSAGGEKITSDHDIWMAEHMF